MRPTTSERSAVRNGQRDERTPVGTNGGDYNWQRNILSLPFERYRTAKVPDVFKLPKAVLYRGLGRSSHLIENLFWDLGMNRCRLFHFFNAIGLGRTPWVTTFETSIPRWRISTELFAASGMRRLVSPTCGRLIAMSQCAYNLQCDRLDEFPELRDEIVRKMTVVHPPQEVFVTDVESRGIEDGITFTMVGDDFFRKGGAEVLRVFARLLDERRDVRLNIVSALAYGDYASKTSPRDLDAALQLIRRYPDRIRHHTKQSNDAVLQLFRRSHVGLLPSYADTYGYSVLEAQANGCPVITTNIRALPEINDEGCGWIIAVPKDHQGNPQLESDKARARFSRLLEEQLEAIVRSVLDDPGMIKKKAARAIAQLRRCHDPKAQAKKIEDIYDAVLAAHGTSA